MPLVQGILKTAFCIGFFVLALVPLLVIIERRLSAWMQGRLGPNRVDIPWLGRLGGILPRGLGHPLADAIKLLFKEEIIPEGADTFLFLAGPVLVLVPPALGLIVLPIMIYHPLQLVVCAWLARHYASRSVAAAIGEGGPLLPVAAAAR